VRSKARRNQLNLAPVIFQAITYRPPLFTMESGVSVHVLVSVDMCKAWLTYTLCRLLCQRIRRVTSLECLNVL